MKSTTVIISALTGILVLSAIAMLAENSKADTKFENSRALASHDPIYIDGNGDFAAENDVTSGSGTQADPYIIENYDINASTANGIEIKNTDAYFIIRNCTIHDGPNQYIGIYFVNVTNGKVEKVTTYNNGVGIYMSDSQQNTITNCEAYNNYCGIVLGDSSKQQNG